MMITLGFFITRAKVNFEAIERISLSGDPYEYGTCPLEVFLPPLHMTIKAQLVTTDQEEEVPREEEAPPFNVFLRWKLVV